MATYLTDDGICLRVIDFSETSQIVGMLTRCHGLVPLIAKGSKRSSKKNTMSGPLDLLTSGQVVFIPARDAHPIGTSTPHDSSPKLGTLAAWDLADHRKSLRSNLPALNAAMICAEVTTLLLQPHDPHESLFAQLEATLELLGKTDAPPPGRTLVAYVKAALVAAGYWPQLAACLACGKPVTSPDKLMRFSTRAGGVVCGDEDAPTCRLDGLGPVLTVPGKILIALERLPPPTTLLAQTPERRADEKALALALQLLFRQIESITDKSLRTAPLVERVFSPTRPQK